MTDALGPILAELRAMWGRRWAGALVAWAVALLAAVIIVRIPDRWEASARVYVDTQTIMKPLMNGLAVQPDVDQMVAMLARTLITRPNLEKLATSLDLAHPGQSQESLDQVVDKLQATIRIVPAGDKNLYIVSYRDTNPRLAELVVQNLVGLFVSSTLGSKRQDSEQARSFIDEQISAYEKKLEEAEGKVKDFKLHHFGFSGVNAQDHYQRLGSLTDDQKKLQLELHAAEQSRDALKRELEGEDPVLLPEASTGARASGTADLDARLEVLNKQLDDLMRRYTDDHPDVVSTKRLIAELEAQKLKEADSQRAKAGKSGPTMMSPASNPVYQQLKVAFAQAEASVASLRAQLNDVTTQLEELRAEANRVPEYEAEMARLTRDYDVIRRNYDQLVQRRETASISEDIDLNASLAVFRVIDPPRVLPTPIFPSRQVLVPLALLVALAAGVLTSLGLAQAFPTVLGALDLRSLTERPLLASISLVSDAPARTRARLANAAFAGAVATLVLGYAGWSTWLLLRSGSV
jgi:polysaccharide chain length determinant protein (PEP-CTERM system associated)